MTKYFENSVGDLLVDPIEANHDDLTELTGAEFESRLAIKNNPPKTYAQRLAELNVWKRREIDRVAVQFAKILLINGTYQNDAEEGIRQSMLAQIENKYDADLQALKTEYGVN